MPVMRPTLPRWARKVILVVWIVGGVLFLYFRMFGHRRRPHPDAAPAPTAAPSPS